MASTSPAFGMIGTLVGLVIMLDGLDAALGSKAALGMPTPAHVEATSEAPTPFQGMAENMEGRLQEVMQRGEVTMARTRKGVYLDVHTDRFYDAGGFTIRPEMKVVLDNVVAELRPRFLEDYKVEIVGHTDDSPILHPPIDSNWDLSAIRSAHIARYLVEQGIDPKRIKATGRADSDPIAPNRNVDGTPNPENRSKNRRVQIKIEH
jgi:chemotaxis protein MotB